MNKIIIPQYSFQVGIRAFFSSSFSFSASPNLPCLKCRPNLSQPPFQNLLTLKNPILSRLAQTLTLFRLQPFSWMVIISCTGHKWSRGTSEDVEWWVIWQVKKRFHQRRIQPMQRGCSKFHGILWKRRLALTICAIQQHKSCGKTWTKCTQIGGISHRYLS